MPASSESRTLANHCPVSSIAISPVKLPPGYTPESTFISVDLPAPFSPTSACTSPGSRLKLTPSSARTPGNVLTMFRISRSGIFVSRTSEFYPDSRQPRKTGHRTFGYNLAMAVDIESVLNEDRVFPPPPEFAADAHVKSFDEYERLYAEAAADPAAYWEKQANDLHWFKRWDEPLEWDLPHAKWFVGGKINISYNCLDRHLDTARAD